MVSSSTKHDGFTFINYDKDTGIKQEFNLPYDTDLYGMVDQFKFFLISAGFSDIEDVTITLKNNPAIISEDL